MVSGKGMLRGLAPSYHKKATRPLSSGREHQPYCTSSGTRLSVSAAACPGQRGIRRASTLTFRRTYLDCLKWALTLRRTFFVNQHFGPRSQKTWDDAHLIPLWPRHEGRLVERLVAVLTHVAEARQQRHTVQGVHRLLQLRPQRSAGDGRAPP
eukprot:gene13088-biopygen20001